MNPRLKWGLIGYAPAVSSVFVVLSLIFGCSVFFIPTLQQNPTGVVAAVVAVVSAVLVFQKQVSDELRAFDTLFAQFNRRYDAMNEGLNKIMQEPFRSDLCRDEHDRLNDYFNLCGEEYLYYKLGSINPEAWKAWASGMAYYLRHPAIAQKWKSEERSESYYGLTLEIIAASTKRKEAQVPNSQQVDIAPCRQPCCKPQDTKTPSDKAESCLLK